MVEMERLEAGSKPRQGAFPFIRLGMLCLALGVDGCVYSSTAPVLPPPEMVIEDRPAALSAPEAQAPASELRPGRIGESGPLPGGRAESEGTAGDEYARIEDLRRRGIITAQEAQRLKRRLRDQE